MTSTRRAGGLTLVELVVSGTCLVLVGGVAVPGLTRVRDDAKVTGCAQNLGTINSALGMLQGDYPGSYTPLWDDGDTVGLTLGHFGRTATWIDLLQQLDYLASRAPGYCPADALPDPLNHQRGRAWGFRYPVALGGNYGMDHSYGISTPYASQADPAQFPCWDPDGDPSRRVMAADGNWAFLINLGGSALASGTYDSPTWGSNTVAYRHKFAANLLHRDGHVALAAYDVDPQDVAPLCNESGLDTTQHFIWRSGEPLEIQYVYGSSPLNTCDGPPPGCTRYPAGDSSPDVLDPSWYTKNHLWTIPDIMQYKGWTQN